MKVSVVLIVVAVTVCAMVQESEQINWSGLISSEPQRKGNSKEESHFPSFDDLFGKVKENVEKVKENVEKVKEKFENIPKEIKNKLGGGGKKDCDKGSPAPDAGTPPANEEPPQPNPVTGDGDVPPADKAPTSSQENGSKQESAGDDRQ